MLRSKDFAIGIFVLFSIAIIFQNCDKKIINETYDQKSNESSISDGFIPVSHTQVFNNHMWKMDGTMKFKKIGSSAINDTVIGSLTLSAPEGVSLIGVSMFVRVLISKNGEFNAEGYPCPGLNTHQDGTKYLYCGSYEDEQSKIFSCNSTSTHCEFSFPIFNIVRSDEIISLTVGFFTTEPRENGAETPELLELEIKDYLK